LIGLVAQWTYNVLTGRVQDRLEWSHEPGDVIKFRSPPDFLIRGPYCRMITSKLKSNSDAWKRAYWRSEIGSTLLVRQCN